MLNFILSGVGVALKVAAPVFVPALMAKLEKKLPETGRGPERRDAVLRAVRALATSLEDDGVISADEREDLYRHVAATIETFVPTVEAAHDMAMPVGLRRLTVSGGYLDVGGAA